MKCPICLAPTKEVGSWCSPCEQAWNRAGRPWHLRAEWSARRSRSAERRRVKTIVAAGDALWQCLYGCVPVEKRIDVVEVWLRATDRKCKAGAR